MWNKSVNGFEIHSNVQRNPKAQLHIFNQYKIRETDFYHTYYLFPFTYYFVLTFTRHDSHTITVAGTPKIISSHAL